MLDQARSPTASGLRAVQALPNAFFALKGDVSRAHRLVKVDKRNWKHLACRTGVHQDKIWLNRVGTFWRGISRLSLEQTHVWIGRGCFLHVGQAWRHATCFTSMTCCGLWARKAALSVLFWQSFLCAYGCPIFVEEVRWWTDLLLGRV